MTCVRAYRTLPRFAGDFAPLQNISRPHTSNTFIHVGRQTFWSSANRAIIRIKARKVLFLLEHGDSPMSRIVFRMFYQDASVAVILYCITLFTFALIVVKTFYKTTGQRTNRDSQKISRVSRPGNV